VIALPAGVWLTGHIGYPPVFVAAAVAALAGIVGVFAMPAHQPRPEQPAGILAGLRIPGLVRPSAVFSATALAAGVVVTFLPLTVARASGTVAALALLAQSAAATFSRWWAGRHGDRHGSAGLLVPGVLAAAAGMLVPVLTADPAAVAVGMALFGAGFGITQNASLTLMFDRAPTSSYATVSALWSVAYDGGWAWAPPASA